MHPVVSGTGAFQYRAIVDNLAQRTSKINPGGATTGCLYLKAHSCPKNGLIGFIKKWIRDEDRDDAPHDDDIAHSEA